MDRGATPASMGDGLPAVSVGTGRHATKLWAQGAGACVLLDDMTLKCWGGNNVGQLGLGDKNDRGNNANEMGDNLPPVVF